jgi:guanylate kinase
MNGFAITVCAPSGAGKTTVCQALLRDSEELMFSVSATTRPKRAKERDGVDYRFVTRDEFQGMIERGELLEWAEVHGELYGTPRSNLEQAEREGKLLLLDIDVQGASQMVDSLPDTVTVFLLPPSFDVLMERLRERGSENASWLERRMQTAKAELEELPSFQYVVVNDALEDTVAAIRAIVDAERQRPGRRLGELDKLRRELEDGLSG